MLEKDIAAVINDLKTSTSGDEQEEPEVLLIIDQPDLLLAATGPSRGIGATEMGDWVMGLQQVCYKSPQAVRYLYREPYPLTASLFA